MSYRHIGFREARNHPGRAILTLASVAIGVAAVVAVTFSTRSTHSAFDEVFKSLAGRASLEVAAGVGQSIPEQLVSTIGEHRGVAALAPRLQRPAILYANGERVQLIAAAVDLERDAMVHDYEIVAGEPLAEANGVLLNQLLAESLGVNVGDRVFLLTRSGRIRVKVAGLFATGGTSMSSVGAGLIAPLRQGQQWFRAPGRLDTIQIVLVDDADKASVRAQIARGLPDNAEVRDPAGRGAMADETVLATYHGLTMARAFILLVATFVIANTFLISVTQRRRQFGTLRALGATQGQIAAIVLAESIVLGIAGAILGSLLGVGVANGLTHAMGDLYQTELPSIQFTPGPFLGGAAFGIGISLLGALLPAIKAGRLAPLEALRDVVPEEIEGASRWLVITGIVTVFTSAILLCLSITNRLGIDISVYAAAFGLVGLVLILPAAMPAVAGALTFLWPRFMRTEARIASRQLLLHRSRTALTVGVVFIAVSAAIALASAVSDNIADVRGWYNRTLVADFYIRAMMPDMATGVAADIPDPVKEELRGISGIARIDAVRLVRVKAAEQDAILIVRETEDQLLHRFDLIQGDEQTIAQQLANGRIVVGSVLAKRADLNLGDQLSLETDDGAHLFRVAAIANDYQAGGLTIYMDRAVAEQHMHIGGVSGYAIAADHDSIEGVRDDLLRIVRRHGLLLQSLSDLQSEIDAMISSIEAGLMGLIALGLLIAAFGVINTLLISVFEQSFEFGLLRTIAASRGQIRKVIFAQALIIGTAALAPAVVAGVGIAYLINLSTFGVTGHMIAFQMRPLLSLTAFAAGLATILVAAWIPAERASHVPLAQMLHLR